MSRYQRQEQESRRAERVSRRMPQEPYFTAIPSMREIPAMCGLGRHYFDQSLPDRGTGWLAQVVARQRFGPIRGPYRIRIARRVREDVEAAAIFRVSEYDARWHLVLLGVRDDEDDRALDAVLRRSIQDAGSSGTRRLYARMPAFVNDEEVLRRAGFVPYMSERILRYRGEGVQGVSSRRVRRIHPADVWGVHQLYLDLVPRQVQYAEAMTSRGWEGSRPLRPGMQRASGWVLEEHGRIRAFARISTMEHPTVARLDLLVAPECRQDAMEVIAPALEEASHLHGVPTIAVVPGYEGELTRILEGIGFENDGMQTAFVCYTTVSARAPMIVVDHWAEPESQPAPVAVPGLGAARVNIATRHDHAVRAEPRRR